MMVDACEPEILERTGPKRLQEAMSRRIDIEFAARDLFEEIVELFV